MKRLRNAVFGGATFTTMTFVVAALFSHEPSVIVTIGVVFAAGAVLGVVFLPEE